MTTRVPVREITEVLEAEYAAAFETPSHAGREPLRCRWPSARWRNTPTTSSSPPATQSFRCLMIPRPVGGSDLLGRYNDIGEEIVRRTPLSELPEPGLVNGKPAS